MELIDRMKKHLIEVKEDHNKLVNSLNKPKSRILRNLTEYELIEKSPITVDKSIEELSSKWETIINVSKIKTISSDNSNIDEIFSLYYNQKPPFSSSGKKKYEFPDAFIIKSIDTWCSVNREKMIILTKDNDFYGYKSKNLIYEKDLTFLLEKITSYYDSLQKEQLIPLIQDTLIRNQEALLDLIDTELYSMIKLDIDYENSTKLNLEKAYFKNYKIISIRPEYAEVTYYIELKYSFTVFPSTIDLERSVFEDNIKPKKISDALIVACDLEINLNKINDIKLKWINSNQLIRIGIEN